MTPEELRHAKRARWATLVSLTLISSCVAVVAAASMHGGRLLGRDQPLDVLGFAMGVSTVFVVPLLSGWAMTVSSLGRAWRLGNLAILLVWGILVWQLVTLTPTDDPPPASGAERS